MRATWLMMGAAVMVAGCGGGAETAGNGAAASSAPVQRQPGSWSTRIEITKFEAPGVDTAKVRQGMQAAMNAASGMSLCLTEEAAARETGANIEQMAQGRNCRWDRKVNTGERVDFAGVCEDQRGQKIRMALSGTSGATAQDLTMAMSPAAAAGTGAGAGPSMEMRVRATRTGACKPGDITPPVPGAPARAPS